MDIQQIKRFIAVAELGSFNRAADLLAVSQPSLTRSIQLLEAMLDARLFERGPRGVELTLIGEELLPHARLILHERDRAISTVSTLSRGARETVVIGTDAPFAMRRLPDALTRMSHLHPLTQIVVRDGNTRDMLNLLREGRLNLVLGAKAPNLDLDELAFEQLTLETASVMMRVGHPLLGQNVPTLIDLVDAQWIVPDHPVLAEGWSQMFLGHDLPVPRIALRTSSLQLAKGCLLSGDYISLGDNSSYADEIEAGRLLAVDVGLSRYERPAGLFRRDGGKLTQGERALIRILHQVCSDDPGYLPPAGSTAAASSASRASKAAS
ncbi:MAG: LysR family transcriptional regulator [Sphingobium sp.]